ncbi:hypothetical protein CMI47_04320 [Candidatus Pacearchaeota archaeon]|nr:hypothetical protein [Candidatus Pacearchaeota archaeon]|tara:strand:- start:7952 stop:8404 length:453 start_codon:yes stop_codon:yes gene_type:complete
MKNKRGVSMMVNYVILIIIAVSLALLVYSFLTVYVPKFQTPECPEGINLIIQDYSCASEVLKINLANKGLFNIDLAKVRLREPGREIKLAVEDEINFPASSQGLVPGENYEYILARVVPSDNYTLEIQPIVFVDDKQALCPAITQPITCS